uniref:AlNc14C10G1286 protein n=1 Tax=Albugo laibachii Nc14 TaxID=890382 RepID=F0W2P6_9STRA|nr:AlNc14C10G1286 [Albugo laibachii Nc14]|eukprot:CCA15332.1 AlNc14C10G1286 [Albugo laibachii Nc14]
MAPTETRRSIRFNVDASNELEEAKQTQKSSNYLLDKMYRRKEFQEVDQKFERFNHLETQLRSLRRELQEALLDTKNTLKPLHAGNDFVLENSLKAGRRRRLGDHGFQAAKTVVEEKYSVESRSFMNGIESLKTMKWDDFRDRIAGFNLATLYSLPSWALRSIAMIALMGIWARCIEVFLEHSSTTSLLSVFASLHRQAVIKRMETLDEKVKTLKIVMSKMQIKSERIFEDAKNHLIRMKGEREQYQQAIKFQMQELRRYMLEMQQVIQSEKISVNVTKEPNDTLMEMHVPRSPPVNHSEEPNAFSITNISAIHTATDSTSQLASENGFLSTASVWKFMAVFLIIFVIGGGVGLRVRYLIHRRKVRAHQYRLRRQSQSNQRRVKHLYQKSDAAEGSDRRVRGGNSERLESEFSRTPRHATDHQALPRVSAQRFSFADRYESWTPARLRRRSYVAQR